MFIVIYNNQTKYVAQVRHDGSVGSEKPTPQFWLQDFVKTNKLNSENYSVTTIEHDVDRSFVIGRDIYDEATNTVYADPDWVAPTPAPVTPTE